MLSLSIVLTVFSMYFIGVSGLLVLPLLINGWMDLYPSTFLTFKYIQVDLLSQRGRAMLRVIEHFAE